MLVSILAFYLNSGFLFVSDIFVCTEYFRQGHICWGALTLTFVLVPSIIVQVFSARWYAADGNLSWSSAISHLLLLQPLERYVSYDPKNGMSLKFRDENNLLLQQPNCDQTLQFIGTKLNNFFTVRNSSCGKVMFSQACVKNSVHTRGMRGKGGHAWWEGMCVGWHAWGCA